jgi:hypothetical protein
VSKRWLLISGVLGGKSRITPQAEGSRLPNGCPERTNGGKKEIIAYFQGMKNTLLPIVLAAGVVGLLTACSGRSGSLRLTGTWQLLSETTITKGVAAVTDYTTGQRMIKIINDTHFAFLRHGLGAARDSSNGFDAGGGSYTLSGDQYTEHLDYYNDKHWEGKTFTFTVSLDKDTLIQRGMEKVEGTGIDREIIEKYLRVKE